MFTQHVIGHYIGRSIEIHGEPTLHSLNVTVLPCPYPCVRHVNLTLCVCVCVFVSLSTGANG